MRNIKNCVCRRIFILIVNFTIHLRVLDSSFLRFRDHTQWHNTVGMTPLDEWSARRRGLYVTTHKTHNRQTSVPQAGYISVCVFKYIYIYVYIHIYIYVTYMGPSVWRRSLRIWRRQGANEIINKWSYLYHCRSQITIWK